VAAPEQARALPKTGASLREPVMRKSGRARRFARCPKIVSVLSSRTRCAPRGQSAEARPTQRNRRRGTQRRLTLLLPGVLLAFAAVRVGGGSLCVVGVAAGRKQRRAGSAGRGVSVSAGRMQRGGRRGARGRRLARARRATPGGRQWLWLLHTPQTPGRSSQAGPGGSGRRSARRRALGRSLWALGCRSAPAWPPGSSRCVSRTLCSSHHASRALASPHAARRVAALLEARWAGDRRVSRPGRGGAVGGDRE
jgi:hypothetical protein